MFQSASTWNDIRMDSEPDTTPDGSDLDGDAVDTPTRADLIDDEEDQLARRARIRAAARVGSAVPLAALTEQTELADEEESDELPDGRFADRELSWLAFNERV